MSLLVSQLLRSTKYILFLNLITSLAYFPWTATEYITDHTESFADEVYVEPQTANCYYQLLDPDTDA